MSNQAAIRQIDANIAESQKFVDLGKSLERLAANKDFIKVVKEAYFQGEAVRLVHLKMDEAMLTTERQASILRQIDAIGTFSAFLRNLEITASRAAQNIEADEQTREEILAEEV